MGKILLEALMIAAIIIGVLGVGSSLFITFSTAGLIGGIICLIIGIGGLIIVRNK